MAETFAAGVCTYGVTKARGSGCIKPAGHDSAHLVTEGDVDDEFCGNEYDADSCELEPGHSGAHLSGNLAWSYGRASTVDLVLASRDLETDLLGGCGICDTEHWEMCAACQKCRCHRHDTCQRPA